MGQVYAWGGISNKNKKLGSCWWWDVPVQESSRRLEKQSHPTRPRGQGTPVPPLHPQNSRGRLSGTHAASLSAPKPPSLHPKLFFPAPRPRRHPAAGLCVPREEAGWRKPKGWCRASRTTKYLHSLPSAPGRGGGNRAISAQAAQQFFCVARSAEKLLNHRPEAGN